VSDDFKIWICGRIVSFGACNEWDKRPMEILGLTEEEFVSAAHLSGMRSSLKGLK
jgi:hypothetical protein